MKFIYGVFLCLLSGLVMASPLPNRPHIYIEGSAEIEVVPDKMTISVGLSAEDMDVETAKKNVDDRSRKLLQALKSQRIDASDIGTTALQISPVYDYVEGRQVPRGYKVYRQVEVTLNNLEHYGELMQALMDAKVSNTVSTNLSVSDEKTVTDRALIEALGDARKRATAVVESGGETLGKVWSISEFDLRREEVYRLVPNAQTFNAPQLGVMAMDQKRASEPFEPGVIRASAKVYVVYLLGSSRPDHSESGR